jgi:hypothetical protein
MCSLPASNCSLLIEGERRGTGPVQQAFTHAPQPQVWLDQHYLSRAPHGAISPRSWDFDPGVLLWPSACLHERPTTTPGPRSRHRSWFKRQRSRLARAPHAQRLTQPRTPRARRPSGHQHIQCALPSGPPSGTRPPWTSHHLCHKYICICIVFVSSSTSRTIAHAAAAAA